MKLRGFRAASPAGEGHSFELAFRRPDDYERNSFSVLIGPNGTRKSRTLRDIIDLSILRAKEDGQLHEGKLGQLRLWRPAATPEASAIKKILAISGVATDRFPSRLTGRRIRSGPLTYAYVGPRSENNLVSRVQSINQIARSLLEQAHKLEERRENLRQAFRLLQLVCKVSFALRPSEAYERAPWSQQEIKKRFIAAQSDDFAEGNRVDQAVLSRCMKILSRQRAVQIRFDLDREKCIRNTAQDLEALTVLMVTGAMTVAESRVTTAKGETLSLSDFSSGQWHVLSSLLFVATAVEDDSLILIDEPENSLHPAWQQQFLPLVRQTIGCVKGAHVIVATHSPLVAASLDPEDAEVISLSVGRGGLLRSRRLPADPFGWTADEILQDVFGLHSARSIDFTSRMDRALALMAKGDRKNSRLVQLVESLRKTQSSLPEDDVAREIIGSMVAVVLGAKADD